MMNFEMNKIYNMDCLLAMKQIPDKYFDWCIADPPYGIGIDGQKESICKNPKHNRKEHTKKDWDNKRLEKEYFDEMKRISKNQIFFGGNYYTDYLEPTKSWLIWYKGQQDLTMADCEMAWCSCNQARVITINRAELIKENTTHPTQKPIKLYKQIIKRYNITGKIIDPFLGSASSIIAYIDNNIDYIGFELDKEYFDIASKRIQQRLNTPTFFDNIITAEPTKIQTTLFEVDND